MDEKYPATLFWIALTQLVRLACVIIVVFALHFLSYRNELTHWARP